MAVAKRQGRETDGEAEVSLGRWRLEDQEWLAPGELTFSHEKVDLMDHRSCRTYANDVSAAEHAVASLMGQGVAQHLGVWLTLAQRHINEADGLRRLMGAYQYEAERQGLPLPLVSSQIASNRDSEALEQGEFLEQLQMRMVERLINIAAHQGIRVLEHAKVRTGMLLTGLGPWLPCVGSPCAGQYILTITPRWRMSRTARVVHTRRTPWPGRAMVLSRGSPVVWRPTVLGQLLGMHAVVGEEERARRAQLTGLERTSFSEPPIHSFYDLVIRSTGHVNAVRTMPRPIIAAAGKAPRARLIGERLLLRVLREELQRTPAK